MKKICEGIENLLTNIMLGKKNLKKTQIQKETCPCFFT